MKKQIKRFSPHQSGKVFGILMAVCSLIFLVPMFAIMLFSMPHADPQENPVGFPKMMIFIMPVMYLVFGYISVAIGSFVYNFFTKYIGGIEFELEDKNA